jgi:hypothetical protein
MENMCWIDLVTNDNSLHGTKEERYIPHIIRRRKTNWTGHILHRNCLLKHIIGGKMEEWIEVAG